MKRPVGIVTGPHGGAGLHALMHAQRLFRGQFDSVIIISAGEVDAEAYGGHEALERLKQQVGDRCAKIVAWSRDHGMPAKVYTGFSTDAVETLRGTLPQGAHRLSQRGLRRDTPDDAAARLGLHPAPWRHGADACSAACTATTRR